LQDAGNFCIEFGHNLVGCFCWGQQDQSKDLNSAAGAPASADWLAVSAIADDLAREETASALIFPALSVGNAEMIGVNPNRVLPPMVSVDMFRRPFQRNMNDIDTRCRNELLGSLHAMRCQFHLKHS
jgi:hypothetical protein